MSNRVMLVEDDEEIQMVLGQLLSMEGYEVQTARDGRAALDMLRQGAAPGVVLLDLMMPVMDGWAVRREMQADPALREVHVIVRSGVVDLAAPQPALQDAEVLLKPLDLDVLLESVARHCAARA